MRLILLALLLSACPRLPPVSGCNPGAQACLANAPHICSTSQRWQRAGDLACSAVGGVCIVTSGRAYCAGLDH